MRAVLLLVQLWSLVQATQAFEKGPRSYMCGTFHVAHGSSMDAREDGSDKNVSLILRKVIGPSDDSEEVDCFDHLQEYTVELKSFDRRIGGFLLGVDKGRFPHDTVTWSLPTSRSGTPLVRSGLCTKSVSHIELLSIVTPAPTLKFGYRAPGSKNIQQLAFRYTVVFDYKHHLEDVTVTIPMCPIPSPSPTPTPSPSLSPSLSPSSSLSLSLSFSPSPSPSPSPAPNMTNESECKVPTTPAPVPVTTPDRILVNDAQCLRDKNISETGSQTVTIEQDNIIYNCVPEKLLKTVECPSECPDNDEVPVCCEVNSYTSRKKNFVCTACSDIPAGSEHLETFEKQFFVWVPSSKCVCFLCPDSRANPTSTLRSNLRSALSS